MQVVKKAVIGEHQSFNRITTLRLANTGPLLISESSTPRPFYHGPNSIQPFWPTKPPPIRRNGTRKESKKRSNHRDVGANSDACTFGASIVTLFRQHARLLPNNHSCCSTTTTSGDSTLVSTQRCYSDLSLNDELSVHNDMTPKRENMKQNCHGIGEGEESWGYFVDIIDEEEILHRDVALPPSVYLPDDIGKYDNISSRLQRRLHLMQGIESKEDEHINPLHRTNNFIRREDGIAFFDMHMTT